MEPTLDLAIARLFGQSDRAAAAKAETAAPPSTAPASGRRHRRGSAWPSRRARLTNVAIDAQRAGDWAKYGEEIKRLGELLERLKQQK
jgi:uncharacterized membrane protein (UPF0182 family)